MGYSTYINIEHFNIFLKKPPTNYYTNYVPNQMHLNSQIVQCIIYKYTHTHVSLYKTITGMNTNTNKWGRGGKQGEKNWTVIISNILIVKIIKANKNISKWYT